MKAFLKRAFNVLASFGFAVVILLFLLLLVFLGTLDQVDKFYLAGGFANFVDPVQAMRIGMIPEMPPEKIEKIGNASIEYAIEAAAAPLAPTPVVDDTGREVISIRDKVDVLETSRQYRDIATPKFRKFPRAELVLRRWLRRGTAGLTVRAG